MKIGKMRFQPPVKKSSLKFLYSLVRGKTARYLLVIGFGTIILASLEGALAYLLSAMLRSLGLLSKGQFPALLLKCGFQDSVASILILIVIVSLIRFLFLFLGNFLTVVCQQETLLKLRQLIFIKVFTASPGEIMPPSRTQFLIGSVAPKVAYFTFQLISLSSCVLQLIALFALMLRTSWELTSGALLMMSLAGLFVFQMSQKIRMISEEIPSSEGGLYARLQISLRNWIFVKIMRLEGREFGELNLLATKQFKSIRYFEVFKNLNYGLTSLFGTLTIVALIYVGFYYWNVPAEALVSFLYLNFRFVGVASTSVNTIDTIIIEAQFLDIAQAELSGCASIEKSIASMASPVESNDFRELPPAVSLQNVSYSYSGTDSVVLSELSLEIVSGQQLGIIGPSGSGKSTLLSIILGILLPTRGSVSINNIDAPSFLSENSHLIGYVGPDPFIIAGTIRTNLIYGSASRIFSDVEIWNALEQSALKTFFTSSDLGLEHVLSESGDGLSVGQKQRLALARALLRRPTLLVLDECTANLDDKTESDLADSLNALRGKVTTIIVSHKKGILRFADQIIDIEKMSGPVLTPVSPEFEMS